MLYRSRPLSKLAGLLLLLAVSTSAQQPSGPFTPPAQKAPAAMTLPAQLSGTPPQVISVVQRLNGMDILKLLERRGVQVDSFPYPMDESQVHTRVAAGYALGEGGGIMTRLPRYEIESLYQNHVWNTTPETTAPHPPKAAGSGTRVEGTPAAKTNNLFVLRSNGQTYLAKFIGLDSSTGLSLLQADGLPAVPAMDADLAHVNLAEAVRIVAPEESQKPLKAGANKMILTFGEVRCQVRNIARESSGEIKSITLSLDNMTPVRARGVVGGVVLNAQGQTIGMVDKSDATSARVIPLSAMRRAAARVRSRQPQQGQPWLGVRGEAVSATSLEQLQKSGWKRTQAQQLRDQQRGVLLTEVPAGTPAARSDLRAGDVVIRVNGDEIADADDFSAIIGRADIETPLTFTVQRPDQAKPESVTVKLGSSRNPVKDTLDRISQGRPGPGIPLEALGIDKIDLTRQLAATFKTKGGWLVRKVEPESPANRAGVLAGDVIETVNGQAAATTNRGVPQVTEWRLGILRRGERIEITVSDEPTKD